MHLKSDRIQVNGLIQLHQSHGLVPRGYMQHARLLGGSPLSAVSLAGGLSNKGPLHSVDDKTWAGQGYLTRSAL